MVAIWSAGSGEGAEQVTIWSAGSGEGRGAGRDLV